MIFPVRDRSRVCSSVSAKEKISPMLSLEECGERGDYGAHFGQFFFLRMGDGRFSGRFGDRERTDRHTRVGPTEFLIGQDQFTTRFGGVKRSIRMEQGE